METPTSGLSLGFAAGTALASGGDARRSPFSHTNTITTEWKSDPVKTNDLLKDIATVLASPVPSPARRLEGDFQAEPTSNRQGSEQSAKELVASLEKLLQKSPSVDSNGQAALLTLRSGLSAAPSPLATARSLTSVTPFLSPQPSSSLAAAGLRSAAAEGPFSSPLPAPAAAPAWALAAAGESLRPTLGRRGSRWQFLASRAASMSPHAGSAGPPPPFTSPPAASPPSFSSPPAASPSYATGSVAALLDRISSVASPPGASPARPSAASQPSPLAAAAARELLPYGSSSFSAGQVPKTQSPLGGGPASPTLSRWQSLARRASVKYDGTRSIVAGAAQQPTASPRSPPQVERVALRPLQLDLRPREGLRFEKEATKVLAELASFAALDSSTTAAFKTVIQKDMGRLFRLPAS